MRVSTLTVLLVLLAVPSAWLLVSHRGRETTEDRLGDVASKIAGRDVEVRCPGAFEELVDASPNAGSVHFGADGRPGDYARLNAQTCAVLDDLVDGETGFGDEARVSKALHILAHESWHLAGIQDEAAADCYAFQHVELAAIRLGAPPDDARALALRAYEDRQATAPPDYRSSECRDGGALDLSPAPGWP